MEINWKFLQDWDNAFSDKFDETSIVAIRLPNGWLVAYTTDSDQPIYWYDLPDAEGLFDGH